MKKSIALLDRGVESSLQQARAITAKAEAENRAPTTDEMEQIRTHNADARDLQKQAAELRAIEKEAADIEAERSKSATVVGGRALASHDPTVDVGRTLSESDPKRGYRSPREFLMDVIAQARTGQVSERLRALRADINGSRTAGSDEQSGFSDPYGGFLVPVAFSPDMLTTTADGDVIGQYVTRIPMSAPTVSIPARTDKDHSTSVTGGLRWYRREQAGDATASRMQTERIVLTASALTGLAYATNELLTDSPISFAALIAAGFNDELASTLLEERINGTGVGQYLGILASPAKVAVAKENAQTQKTINYTNIIKMRARCWGYQNAVWLVNHDTLPQLMSLSLAVGTGGSAMWQTSAVPDRPDTLLGRPVIVCESCQTLGTEGDIILWNPKEYLEATYQQPESGESIHVRFVTNETAFRFQVRNAAAPWWRSALTPKKSADTLSPIVTLAVRA